jgi:hypothetical protein
MFTGRVNVDTSCDLKFWNNGHVDCKDIPVVAVRLTDLTMLLFLIGAC